MPLFAFLFSSTIVVLTITSIYGPFWLDALNRSAGHEQEAANSAVFHTEFCTRVEVESI